jgi:hypothetical protein
MNWMLLLDLIMTFMAFWLVGHIIANEYCHWTGKYDVFLSLKDLNFWQRMGTFHFWWYGLSVLTILYFVVRLFG